MISEMEGCLRTAIVRSSIQVKYKFSEKNIEE